VSLHGLWWFSLPLTTGSRTELTAMLGNGEPFQLKSWYWLRLTNYYCEILFQRFNFLEKTDIDGKMLTAWQLKHEYSTTSD
jgi:hypothetical protein